MVARARFIRCRARRRNSERAHSYRGSDAANLVHSGAEGDKKALVVFFDKQKIVHDFTMSTSRINVSQGAITR